jgi:short-subunit dehydrogenase
MTNTIAIVGAGPGLGLSLARRFGREGFNVALIARNQDKLAALVAQLTTDGINAAPFIADVADLPSLERAFADIEHRFGKIDVLEYSPVTLPGPESYPSLEATQLTATRASSDLQLSLGAISSVQQVLPAMLARRAGTILVTVGASAKVFIPMLASWGFAGAALRNYVRSLAIAVRDHGVYVAAVVLGVQIAKGDAFGDPDQLAERYHQLYLERRQPELVINHLPEAMFERDLE